MLGKSVGRDGAKRAGTDMQRQRAELDSMLDQAFEQRRGEVQPGRRRATAPGTWAYTV